MNKYDQAMYLVNLHTLMEAQVATGGINKSQWLVEEYQRGWLELKEMVQDEARKGPQQPVGNAA